MFWKYPSLIDLFNERTIEEIQPVYLTNIKTTKEFNNYIQDGKLLIGYILHTTTGLLSDKTVCIFRFMEEILELKDFKDLLESNKERVCIIDCYSESWGIKKVKLAREILKEWIQDYLDDNDLSKEYVLDGNETTLNNSCKLNLKINIRVQY